MSLVCVWVSCLCLCLLLVFVSLVSVCVSSLCLLFVSGSPVCVWVSCLCLGLLLVFGSLAIFVSHPIMCQCFFSSSLYLCLSVFVRFVSGSNLCYLSVLFLFLLLCVCVCVCVSHVFQLAFVVFISLLSSFVISYQSVFVEFVSDLPFVIIY